MVFLGMNILYLFIYFELQVMTKPTSGLNTMTNLCNHKRKMMFNNSENKFNKYSCEMGENRKKRRLSGVHQQYPFPSYEDEKVGKENFSQVPNSHHVSLYYYYFCAQYIVFLNTLITIFD